jgi:hypothetical protein
LLLGLAILLLLGAFQQAPAQVLGPCGTPQEGEAVASGEAPAPSPGGAPVAMQRVPLPGERALNFELQAVVGDEIKMVRLSDYNGSWRVVCFYPADFTFV